MHFVVRYVDLLRNLGLPPQWKSRQVQLKGQAALDSIVSAVNDSNHCVKLMEGLLQRHEFMLVSLLLSSRLTCIKANEEGWMFVFCAAQVTVRVGPKTCLQANRQGLAAMECASEKFGDGLNHGVNNLIDVLQGAHLGGEDIVYRLCRMFTLPQNQNNFGICSLACFQESWTAFYHHNTSQGKPVLSKRWGHFLIMLSPMAPVEHAECCAFVFLTDECLCPLPERRLSRY